MVFLTGCLALAAWGRLVVGEICTDELADIGEFEVGRKHWVKAGVKKTVGAGTTNGSIMHQKLSRQAQRVVLLALVGDNGRDLLRLMSNQ